MPHAGGDAVLEVVGLSVRFRTDDRVLTAADEVSFAIAPGETLALLGESGSGKSVTARAVMGLLAGREVDVEATRLVLGGTDLLRLPVDQRRALRGPQMTLVFQDALSALNPVLRVGDQIGELFRVHERTSRRVARSRSVDLLRRVGIPAPDSRVDDYPHQFSGGMRQRLLVAMAIALQPRLLIADEPTTALDVTVQAQVLELLAELCGEMGTAVLLITHDMGIVAEVADRVAVMYAGRIVETAPVEDIFVAPGHPYTEALLRSVPRIDRPAAELHPIVGTPPSPLALPSGCAFRPRCGYAVDVCAEVRPDLAPVGGSDVRMSACHRREEVGRAGVTGVVGGAGVTGGADQLEGSG
ncbi:ABC transporter ATP-binding protein [Actinopolymorpha sp. B9G3]|uniref:ABC transporter ATP-binding protein n=1 Tax=Actinopolymorpha sp. B9G3 TaxID=3158970 RepID=UPI0032D9736F